MDEDQFVLSFFITPYTKPDQIWIMFPRPLLKGNEESRSETEAVTHMNSVWLTYLCG